MRALLEDERGNGKGKERRREGGHGVSNEALTWIWGGMRTECRDSGCAGSGMRHGGIWNEMKISQRTDATGINWEVAAESVVWTKVAELGTSVSRRAQ